MRVWLNGTLLGAEAARIAPEDRGFTLGDGLFETIRAVDGAPVRLDAHLSRLWRGASILGLPVPHLDFDGVMRATLAANRLSEGALRLTLTRGPAPRGVLPPSDPAPTLLITAGPLPPMTALRLVIAQVTRRNEFSPLSGIKSLNYLDNILARQEAAERGADDALLLNTQGRIAETSTANVFVVREGRLMTPPLMDGALPGVLRAEILRLGAVEQPLTPDDLAQAQEMFVTTSLGIRSVVEVENRPLNEGIVVQEMRAKLG
ncbi:aminotransferase class IV [Aquabacter cavernae]|uniref:aminotransferase class IV n=1 Tax=Aquabacter cavernae TaxID=2496029 RepID=UPI000F8CB452|nr:aminotransferase class IV [Aquabacter cavernae]